MQDIHAESPARKIRFEIFDEVELERDRQDERFGTMPRNRNPLKWLRDLTEEIGEVANELDSEYSNNQPGSGYETELIQVAASAIAALEDFRMSRTTE